MEKLFQLMEISNSFAEHAALYFFASIVIILGISSLRGGFRFASYVETESSKTREVFTPFVSIIAPCRGLEEGLRENLVALFHQNYPAYEIIFVTDRADDPSLNVIEELRYARKDVSPKTRVVIAGAAIDCGQKVHNLQVASAVAGPDTEVFVFVDSDARPHAGWLRSLVEPLSDSKLGATTGYRWFVPSSGGFASHLRSVWNASITSSLGAASEKNFCWGGSTAILRARFEALRVRERWQGTVSDDFTLTRVLSEAKLPIHFVPNCLVLTVEDCTLRELFEFSNRQLKITRVYAPHLWKPVLLGSLLFVSVFFGGVVLVLVNAALGRLHWLPFLIVTIIFALGALKSYLRWRTVTTVLGPAAQLPNTLLAHVFLWPAASALYLWNAVVALFSRRIEWRGITYELKSPDQAVIIPKTSNE